MNDLYSNSPDTGWTQKTPITELLPLIISGNDDALMVPDDSVVNIPGTAGVFDVFALSSRQLGLLGEAYTALQLEEHGYRVLARNWRTRYGELDIIAFSEDQTIAFVEVKTRRSIRAGHPYEAVTVTKQQHLRLAARQWLAAADKPLNHGLRFDVASIVMNNSTIDFTYYQGAF